MSAELFSQEFSREREKVVVDLCTVDRWIIFCFLGIRTEPTLPPVLFISLWKWATVVCAFIGNGIFALSKFTLDVCYCSPLELPLGLIRG